MPFDGLSVTDPAIALARFREAPTLADLAIILRNQKSVLPDWPWDYTTCCTCAVGMVCELGGFREFRELPGTTATRMGVFFGIPRDAAFRIFIAAYLNVRARRPKDVRPEHVADAIDNYLATVA